MPDLRFSNLPPADKIISLLDPDGGGAAPVTNSGEVLIVRGTMRGEPVWMVAQNGKIAGGTLGAAHTRVLLDMTGAVLVERPKAVVMLLESGGVRLHEGNRGMVGLARVMEQMLAVRRAGIVTVAVIGGRFGCWGGATLIAGVCDQVLMVHGTRCGLSGPKALQEMARVQAQAVDNEALQRYLTATHRQQTGEVDAAIDDNAGALREAIGDVIMQAGTDPINRAETVLTQCEARFDGIRFHSHGISAALPGVALSSPERESWNQVFESYQLASAAPGVVAGSGQLSGQTVPFFGCTLDTAMGPAQGLALLRAALKAHRARPSGILLLADAVQAFDIENEQYGYGQVLGALAQVLGHTAATLCPVVGLLQSAGSGASMVALSMCGVSLYARRGAQIHPLPPNVVAAFVGENARENIDADPSVENFRQLGAVREVLDGDWASRLREVMRNAAIASSAQVV